MHSAISSSSPDSPCHSSLHVYTLCIPQQRHRIPLRTGFHRACRTGWECKRTVLNLGGLVSPAEGKSKRSTALGTFSLEGCIVIKDWKWSPRLGTHQISRVGGSQSDSSLVGRAHFSDEVLSSQPEVYSVIEIRTNVRLSACQ